MCSGLLLNNELLLKTPAKQSPLFTVSICVFTRVPLPTVSAQVDIKKRQSWCVFCYLCFFPENTLCIHVSTQRADVCISLISLLACFPLSSIDVAQNLCESMSVSLQCSIPSFDRAEGIKAFFMSLKPDVQELFWIFIRWLPIFFFFLKPVHNFSSERYVLWLCVWERGKECEKKKGSWHVCSHVCMSNKETEEERGKRGLVSSENRPPLNILIQHFFVFPQVSGSKCHPPWTLPRSGTSSVWRTGEWSLWWLSTAWLQIGPGWALHGPMSEESCYGLVSQHGRSQSEDRPPLMRPSLFS